MTDYFSLRWDGSHYRGGFLAESLTDSSSFQSDTSFYHLQNGTFTGTDPTSEVSSLGHAADVTNAHLPGGLAAGAGYPLPVGTTQPQESCQWYWYKGELSQDEEQQQHNSLLDAADGASQDLDLPDAAWDLDPESALRVAELNCLIGDFGTDYSHTVDEFHRAAEADGLKDNGGIAEQAGVSHAVAQLAAQVTYEQTIVKEEECENAASTLSSDYQETIAKIKYLAQYIPELGTAATEASVTFPEIECLKDSIDEPASSTCPPQFEMSHPAGDSIHSSPASFKRYLDEPITATALAQQSAASVPPNHPQQPSPPELLEQQQSPTPEPSLPPCCQIHAHNLTALRKHRRCHDKTLHCPTHPNHGPFYTRKDLLRHLLGMEHACERLTCGAQDERTGTTCTKTFVGRLDNLKRHLVKGRGHRWGVARAEEWCARERERLEGRKEVLKRAL